MLFETIKIINGVAQNIDYHQARFDLARSELFGMVNQIDLNSLITPPNSETLRCKIIYSKDIINIEYTTYKPREFQNFILVAENIEYNYKYCDRSIFDRLSSENSGFDDIIIVKNGLLSDTIIANIAFFDGKDWITPKTPLLKGTTRARLLKSGFLKQRDIKPDEISMCSKFAIMNALIGFYEIKEFEIKGN